MANFNCNILYVILGLIILIGVIYYLNKNDDQPVHNSGTISPPNNNTKTKQNIKISKTPIKNTAINASNIPKTANIPKKTNIANVTNTSGVANKNNIQQQNVASDYNLGDSIVDDLVAKYGQLNNGYVPSDPLSSDYSPFAGYLKKKQLELQNTENPYADQEDCDESDFIFKKQKYVKRTPDDVRDLFDVQKMLPQETEPGWFDTVPLQSTKKIRGTHYIHPKVHMGNDTKGGSLRNGTHDIRGDIPNPKLNVGPWGISTIEADTNLKGLCS